MVGLIVSAPSRANVAGRGDSAGIVRHLGPCDPMKWELYQRIMTEVSYGRYRISLYKRSAIGE